MRRAVLLRSVLKKLDLEGKVEEDVIHALLTIPEFKHGAGSLQTVLEMSEPHQGIVKRASLPAAKQMDMHVDAAQFSELIKPEIRRAKEF